MCWVERLRVITGLVVMMLFYSLRLRGSSYLLVVRAVRNEGMGRNSVQFLY